MRIYLIARMSSSYLTDLALRELFRWEIVGGYGHPIGSRDHEISLFKEDLRIEEIRVASRNVPAFPQA